MKNVLHEEDIEELSSYEENDSVSSDSILDALNPPKTIRGLQRNSILLFQFLSDLERRVDDRKSSESEDY